MMKKVGDKSRYKDPSFYQKYQLFIVQIYGEQTKVTNLFLEKIKDCILKNQNYVILFI